MSHKRELTTIVFSKNRAAQLELLLHSLTIDNVTVLYTYDKEFSTGYTRLKKMYPKVKFIKEINFQKQLISLIDRGGNYVMFLVDDDIMVRPFSEDSEEFKEFKKNKKIVSLSLRMSPAYKYKGLPELKENTWEWWRYIRKSPEFNYWTRDWGCLAVGGNIFRKGDIFPIIKSTQGLRSPNYLELALNAKKFKNRPLMKCFDDVKIVNNKANQVQTDFPTPRQSMNISIADLEKRFVSGDRLSLSDIINKSSGAINGFIKAQYAWGSDMTEKSNKKILVSVIMPADKDPFIQRTIDSLLNNAKTQIEVLVVLDNYLPDPPLKANPRVRVINSPGHGMRAAINEGIANACGKFIMKCDCHCAFGPGYDKIMAENCKENWVVNPIHYNIDYISWERIMNPAFIYHCIGYPEVTPYHGTMLPVRSWTERQHTRQDRKHDIDDTMSIIGGCWFANRKYFLKHVGILNNYPNAYGLHVEENHEISLKYWLGGGRAKINKKTWFAHFAKRPHLAHIYQSKFDDRSGASNRTWICRHWVNNEEPDMIHPFSWLVEKFWPVPGWPEDRSLWTFPEEKSGIQTNANMQYQLTYLCKLAIKYNSVKCPRLVHCYTPFYYEFFNKRRMEVKKVLEIGDPGYAGADLRMWRDLLPKAHVFGANTNPKSVFPGDRITTYRFDEADEKDIQKLVSTVGSDVDLVIDNASNHSYHQMFLFQTLMPLLDKKVTYVVENCGRTRQMSRAYHRYNYQVPSLLPNKNQVRDGLIVFTYKNT